MSEACGGSLVAELECRLVRGQPMNRRLLLVPFLAAFAVVAACDGAEEVCEKEFITTHPDLDGDGFGDAGAPEQTCGVTKGRVENSGDCDDTNELSNIDAEEVCDLLDNNCDGQVDEGLPFQVWYTDADQDGFGAGDASIETCLPPEGAVATGDDCNDAAAAINPDAAEICDGQDNDCDELIDDEDDDVDASSMTTYYHDEDADGYGDFLIPIEACALPAAAAENGEDCDDNAIDVNPAALEICNNIDDNCDTLIDEDDPTIDPGLLTAYFEDADGDGWGDLLAPVQACDPGPGIVDNFDDCDDNDFLLGPAGDWFADGDLDGFGFGPAIETNTCVPVDPTLVPDGQGLDCDDSNAAINPLAVEICGDGIDSNCDSHDCDAWIEDFESNAMNPLFTFTGDADWNILATTPWEGVYGGKSGNINDNQTSDMSLTVDITSPGSVSFYHAGDTEQGFDFLRFLVDGNQVASNSGNWGWTLYQTNLSVGQHTLTWRYSKDFSLSFGADTVYVDYIEIIGGQPF